MARGRNDDIFKKLKKETPLVKRKDLQPLSPRDFTPRRSAFDTLIEKSEARGERRAADPKVFSSGPLNRSKPTAPAKEKRPVRTPAAKTRQTKKTELMIGPEPSGKLPVRRREPEKEPERRQRSEPEIFEPRHAERPSEPVPAAPRREVEYTAPVVPRRPQTAPAAPVAIGTVSEAEQSGETYRHELKYYINFRDYTLLRHSLRAMMSLDAYAGPEGMYHIRSLYFDDMYDSALREKVAGCDDRSKYRIRIYNFRDDKIRFEKKYKTGQYVSKSDILLSRDEYERIIAGEYAFLLQRDEPLARELFLQLTNNRLRPRVLVDYRREAYVSPFENVRITFDRDLRGGVLLTDIFDPNAPVMPMFDVGIMVLEVKFGRYLPHYILGVLNNINAADRSAISKYVICRKFD